MNSVVSLVMFGLVLNGLVSAQTLIQDLCKKAVATDEFLDYNFCVKSLTQDPQSKSATNLEGLVLASAKNAQVVLMNLRGIVEQMFKDKKGQGIAAELRTCLIFYDNAKDDLNVGLTNFKAHDYQSAQGHFDEAEDAPLNCEYIFRESEKKSPITNENNNLLQKIRIPHDFTTMLL